MLFVCCVSRCVCLCCLLDCFFGGSFSLCVCVCLVVCVRVYVCLFFCFVVCLGFFVCLFGCRFCFVSLVVWLQVACQDYLQIRVIYKSHVFTNTPQEITQGGYLQITHIYK